MIRGKAIRPLTVLFLWLNITIILSASVSESRTVWQMLNVTPNEGQADCNLLTFPDGSRVLIDAADAWDARQTVVAKLEQKGINHLALVVISHFHHDHYRSLTELIEAGITVDRVMINLPHQKIAKKEIPWGYDEEDVLRVINFLQARRIPYFTPKAGDRILEITGKDRMSAGIDVVCLYDGINTPIGETSINDTSILLRVFHGPRTILFTGDLGGPLSQYLADSTIDLKADLLKAPHHGTDSTATNHFLDRVGASAVLVSSPRKLWQSARSMRLRNYFLEKQTPTYVTGMVGDITVILTQSQVTIRTQF